jgi:hypothetical protein
VKPRGFAVKPPCVVACEAPLADATPKCVHRPSSRDVPFLGRPGDQAARS